ncbi:hypothetical protein KR009_011895 [Drosophila setifemur]|nr:hypothetical protein KR009_011895 [Drosophila setifemur]
MSSVQASLASPWLIVIHFAILPWLYQAAPMLHDADLQQLTKLNLIQAKLITNNSTAKCSLTPFFCDWQLHLYEGHTFSVPLAQTVVSTTSMAPPISRDPEIFDLTSLQSGAQLFIVAEVEPKKRQVLRAKRKHRRRTTGN